MKNNITNIAKSGMVFLALFALVVCRIASGQQDIECCDMEIDTSIENVIEFDESHWKAERLEILRTHLPDLHLQLTSPEWETTDGMQQQRISALATLKALGAESDEIDVLQEKINAYDQEVPDHARQTVRAALSSVGEALVDNFISIHMDRSQIVQPIIDAFEYYEESHPKKLSRLNECLDVAIKKRGKVTMVHFENWVFSLESENPNKVGIDFDPALLSIQSSNTLKIRLLDNVIESNRDYLLCVRDLDFGAEDKSE